MDGTGTGDLAKYVAFILVMLNIPVLLPKFALPISHCSISSVLLRNFKPRRLDIVEFGCKFEH
jgi:hypothetical protein